MLVVKKNELKFVSVGGGMVEIYSNRSSFPDAPIEVFKVSGEVNKNTIARLVKDYK